MEYTKNQRKEALNDMIDRIEFTAKNLKSNVVVLLLLNHTNEQGMFQTLDEILVFNNKSTEDKKINHLKTLICVGFVGVGKLDRFLLLTRRAEYHGLARGYLVRLAGVIAWQ